MARRIFLLILTNILVITTIAIVLSLLGLHSYINASGTIDYYSLLLFSLIVGFTGAFFSLAMSRIMAKMIMRVQVLDPKGNLSSNERALVEKVHHLAKNAGLRAMPEVGIYHSPEVNAFATGPTKSRSLVAVSAGLLNRMDDAAIEGVLAHEISHITNGDMVTMTLLQGIVNTFVVFLSRIIAFAASRFVKEDMQPIVHFMSIIFFQFVLSILGSLVVFAYSRHREYQADEGAAYLAGKDKMIHALKSLKHSVELVDTKQASLATLKISNRKGVLSLFSTHPDLDDRIARLEGK